MRTTPRTSRAFTLVEVLIASTILFATITVISESYRASLMASDKAKNHILPISQLGIMQMTRQRQQESLSSNLYTDCPYCRGRGIVKSATTMSV